MKAGSRRELATRRNFDPRGGCVRGSARQREPYYVTGPGTTLNQQAGRIPGKPSARHAYVVDEVRPDRPGPGHDRGPCFEGDRSASSRTLARVPTRPGRRSTPTRTAAFVVLPAGRRLRGLKPRRPRLGSCRPTAPKTLKRNLILEYLETIPRARHRTQASPGPIRSRFCKIEPGQTRCVPRASGRRGRRRAPESAPNGAPKRFVQNARTCDPPRVPSTGPLRPNSPAATSARFETRVWRALAPARSSPERHRADFAREPRARRRRPKSCGSGRSSRLDTTPGCEPTARQGRRRSPLRGQRPSPRRLMNYVVRPCQA